MRSITQVSEMLPGVDVCSILTSSFQVSYLLQDSSLSSTSNIFPTSFSELQLSNTESTTAISIMSRSILTPLASNLAGNLTSSHISDSDSSNNGSTSTIGAKLRSTPISSASNSESFNAQTSPRPVSALPANTSNSSSNLSIVTPITPLETSSQSQSLASGEAAFPGSSTGSDSAPITASAPLEGTQDSSATSTNPALANAVTATDTIEPSNIATEGSTNTAWTENFWLTTQRNGQTTVVPVIVGCPGCGSKGGGIILWNFPPLPKVSFQFPKFPALPPISFPCIPIPLLKSCSSPPSSEYVEFFSIPVC